MQTAECRVKIEKTLLFRGYYDKQKIHIIIGIDALSNPNLFLEGIDDLYLLPYHCPPIADGDPL